MGRARQNNCRLISRVYSDLPTGIKRHDSAPPCLSEIIFSFHASKYKKGPEATNYLLTSSTYKTAAQTMRASSALKIDSYSKIVKPINLIEFYYCVCVRDLLALESKTAFFGHNRFYLRKLPLAREYIESGFDFSLHRRDMRTITN